MSHQNIDDVIMCLVGMGFDLDDAEQAVKMGKITTEQAVEWKTGIPATQHQPVLQLGPPHSEPAGAMAAFSQPVSVQRPPVAQQSPAEQLEDKVVSRMHLSEKERDGKAKFESQQRDEARKRAREEKLAEKRAKHAALRQIEEDKERRRALKAPTPGPSQTQAAENTAGPSASTSQTSATANDKTSSVIQVRLPDGRALRRSFPGEAQFREVRAWVIQDFPSAASMALIQPFPRQEFAEACFGRTLVDLALYPSGNLVLKLSEAAGKEVKVTEKAQTEAASTSGSEEDGPSHVATHSWGHGNKLDENEAVGGNEEQAVPQDDAMNDEEDDESMDEDDVNPHVHGGHHHMASQAFTGVGQSLDSRPVELMEHVNQLPTELARERALARFREEPPHPMEVVESPSASSLTQEVRSLTQLLIEHISERVCDTKNPILRLQRIPADVASKVLEYLVKERRLKPKTLQPFISCRMRKISLDCYPYATNELMSALKHHVYLTYLSLSSCTLINEEGLRHLQALKRLKFLSFSKCSQVNDGCVSLISGLPKLVTLVLEGTGVTDDGLQHLSKCNLQNLQNLNLRLTKISNLGLQHLCHIQTLRNLSLEHTAISSLSGIENLGSLDTLNIAGTFIVTESLLVLAQLSHLKALNIANTENVIGDLALKYISDINLNLLTLPSRLSTSNEGLRHVRNMHLQTLDLTNYIHISDGACEFIGQIHSLKRLYLTNTKVSDAGVLLLAGLSQLEVLHLDRTLVTDGCGSVFRRFTQLADLSLTDTAVSSVLLQTAALEGCVCLMKLNLSRTNVCDKGLAVIKFPRLHLLSLDGTCVTEGRALQLSNSACPQLQKVSCNNLRPRREAEENV